MRTRAAAGGRTEPEVPWSGLLGQPRNIVVLAGGVAAAAIVWLLSGDAGNAFWSGLIAAFLVASQVIDWPSRSRSARGSSDIGRIRRGRKGSRRTTTCTGTGGHGGSAVRPARSADDGPWAPESKHRWKPPDPAVDGDRGRADHPWTMRRDSVSGGLVPVAVGWMLVAGFVIACASPGPRGPSRTCWRPRTRPTAARRLRRRRPSRRPRRGRVPVAARPPRRAARARGSASPSGPVVPFRLTSSRLHRGRRHPARVHL